MKHVKRFFLYISFCLITALILCFSSYCSITVYSAIDTTSDIDSTSSSGESPRTEKKDNSATYGLLGVIIGAILSFFANLLAEFIKIKAIKTDHELQESEKKRQVLLDSYKEYLYQITIINSLIRRKKLGQQVEDEIKQAINSFYIQHSLIEIIGSKDVITQGEIIKKSFSKTQPESIDNLCYKSLCDKIRASMDQTTSKQIF